MTTAPVSVSIVIVSRHRPEALRRCLTGVEQLQYTPFEVIVVADPAGLAVARSLPFAAALKLVAFDEPNISAARNLGIAQAAGTVVAFIDDDAVPEPQWLRYLMAPATDPAVAAFTGFVRGRNGISFQYQARRLNAWGIAEALSLDPAAPTVLPAPATGAIKTEGTNMAFRRDVLLDLGGFDPAFHYFLDETDLNMRLAQAGHATAIAPLAEVHHGFAANAMRNAKRVPQDLYDIGASWAVFQRKHIPQPDRAAHWAQWRQEERQRLLKHLLSGGLEPRDVTRLLGRLDEGYAEGQTRVFGAHSVAQASEMFRAFPARERKSSLIGTRPWRLSQDRAAAADRVAKGEIVTLVCLSPTLFYHCLSFEPEEGIWLQRGGIYGKSLRNTALFRRISRKTRVLIEAKRIACQRGLSDD